MLHIVASERVAQFGWMKTPAEFTDAQILGQALAQLREERGLSQPEAADRMGLGSGAGWGKYEQGKAPSIFHPDTQKRLLSALDATLEEWMLARTKIAGGDAPPILARPTQLESGRRGLEPAPGLCAVYGMVAGEGERVAVAAGSEIRYVPMHPGQRGYSKIGAAEVVGESMYPRWKPRELAYFVFDLPPPRGDDVIVELQDGTAMIKEYVGRTPSHLMLKEWSPVERTFDVPLENVRALHAVVG